jgi:hypothetical protein
MSTPTQRSPVDLELARDISRSRRHRSAQWTASFALLVAMASVPVACKGASHGVLSSAVPCSEDVEGAGVPRDAPEGTVCGAAECGYAVECLSGMWTTVNHPPTCPTSAPAPQSACDGFCGPDACGPFPITTSCGVEQLTAECTDNGWLYPSPTCTPDCKSFGDAASCGATFGCAWIATCSDSPVQLTGCLDLYAFATSHCTTGTTGTGGSITTTVGAGGQTTGTGSTTCPAGQTCQMIKVFGPSNLTATDCSHDDVWVSICTP